LLDIIYTSTFKKDFKRISKQEKDLLIIEKVISELTFNKKLANKYYDHLLIGNYKNKRECHLSPDWLLIYEIDDNKLVLYRTGSHSDLFK
jgi:mRNA interferase YafQ